MKTQIALNWQLMSDSEPPDGVPVWLIFLPEYGQPHTISTFTYTYKSSRETFYGQGEEYETPDSIYAWCINNFAGWEVDPQTGIVRP